jgi:hypothetical protein
MYGPVGQNCFIVAKDAFAAGQLELAWKIVDALDRDPAKDPMPKAFYDLKEQVKKKVIEKGLSLDTGFDQMIKDGQLFTLKQRPKEDKIRD